MRNIIISLIFFLGLVPLVARAEALQLQEKAPDRYVVVPGDTLWGISGRFLKDPWRWPEIWGMNREEIENPHLIYPGDVIVLENKGGVPRLRIATQGGAGSYQDGQERKTVRLSPRIQSMDLGRAIASIPLSEIGPFLTRTQLVEKADWEAAPQIVAGENSADILGAGEFGYVTGLNASKSVSWDIYAKGREILDPDTRKLLGYEVDYLGEARLLRLGKPSKVEIVRSAREIAIGARLLPVSEPTVTHYVPHAPDRMIKGRIMSSVGNRTEIGQDDIVGLNLGSGDGIELGNVLAVYRKGKSVESEGAEIPLPPERIGLVLVFRTYAKVSYALVVQSSRTIHITDTVQTP